MCALGTEGVEVEEEDGARSSVATFPKDIFCSLSLSFGAR